MRVMTKYLLDNKQSHSKIETSKDSVIRQTDIEMSDMFDIFIIFQKFENVGFCWKKNDFLGFFGNF